MTVFKILMLALSLSSLALHAQEPRISVLTFQAWKEQQILEAQNQVLRASTRLTQLKAGRGTSARNKKPAQLPNDKVREAEESETSIAEKELARAQESLQSANDLEFEAYINVYLPTLQDHPEALQKLAEKLSKEELAEVFKALMRARASGSQRTSALLEGLTPATTKTR
ncbi:MAG: hypothetical protein HC902_11230 [Calothrix sp. SM1_5_4]|nr:hypothetical protein [Calothrix sp. SM1_5_4]